MLLKIDNRERTIIPALTKACDAIDGVVVNVESMPIGDAGIYSDDGQELILFERKSLSDLAASIKDGRYSEQSMRLSAIDTHNHNIVYVIEGSLDAYNYSRNRVHPDTLRSAMVSLNYYKGFSVARSWSILETIDVIMGYVRKLLKTKDKTAYYKNGKKEQTSDEPSTNTVGNNSVEYVSTIKRTKKENVTIQNIVTIMLCQIPNVSSLSADAISSEYGTLESLIEACKRGRDAFENIRLKTSNRRLPSHCISSVITYVLAKPPPVLDAADWQQ